MICYHKSANDKARYDTEVKNVLSDKNILAWIMSRVTDEFRGMSIEDIIPCIEGEPLISKVYVAPGKTNERIKIIINVEAQKERGFSGEDFDEL